MQHCRETEGRAWWRLREKKLDRSNDVQPRQTKLITAKEEELAKMTQELKQECGKSRMKQAKKQEGYDECEKQQAEAKAFLVGISKMFYIF